MSKIEFLARYMIIEQQLHFMHPNFGVDETSGLLSALLRAGRISEGLFKDLTAILNLRNRLVGEHGTETSISEPMAKTIISIKEALAI